MINPQPVPATSFPGAVANSGDSSKPAKPPHTDTARDHFESVLFALVLALLFRTFEAEAFVIPTGSMAPTLYGRNKETTCTHCGHPLVIGASDELNAEAGRMYEGARIDKAICPNCRGANDVEDALAFNGDRILVNKFPYELGNPSRWDVFVFKYPEEPHINYIKRLVGLPGETIRVRQGNLYLWDGKTETVLRKDDVEKQKVLQIPLYDDRHAPKELLKAGWPERWASVEKGEGADAVAGWSPSQAGWTQDAEARKFQLTGKEAGKLSWLRYRNYTPSLPDWEQALSGGKLAAQPQLVTDFCGYNTYSGSTGQRFEARGVDEIDTGEFWVGDLTLSALVEIEDAADNSKLVLELVEGGIAYQCRIDCRSATAVLFKMTPDREVELASAPCGISGAGSYELRYANVDDRLVLWVNDQVVEFGAGASLDQSNAITATLPTEDDLTPVAIAAEGLNLSVSDLLIERDIYYRADMSFEDRFGGDQARFRRDLARNVQRPDEWSRLYQQEAESLDTLELKVDPDGFLAFGDNSPRSRDSRLWAKEMQSVPRRFLVGKAFFIYWPHGVPFLNNGRGFPIAAHRDMAGNTVEDYPRYTAPFYPQIGRMKRIR